ncbi:hypothetical protein SLEP1_g3775 [Rubroshorea leprosula]|uniref:Aminotransferase-like plant mobile domain-containing protein n=1 Tax=Rubroshorea leprosula TaxID=152421 RepID=A0AAV5HLJ4_9ROSI|nr:hypothetical protein SLEP1_g3775 [Rubroshorea leprosula]
MWSATIACEEVVHEYPYFYPCFSGGYCDSGRRGESDVAAYYWGRGSTAHNVNTRGACHASSFEEGKVSLCVRATCLTSWLSKFVFGGFLSHEIMAKCIPLAIRLVEGVKLPLASLMLGTLYHMLDLLHFDEILGASYYIIESHVCLSLLQMFAWERFRPYHFGCVTSGKALKEYPMAKCGYTNGTALLASYKTMLGTFAPPEVSLFDKTLPVVLGNQIVEFTMGSSSHLEMLVVITPSMMPCMTWRGMWSLKCYYLERVMRQFGYDQDVPLAPSSNKTDWNKAMPPYVDETATAMWSGGTATQEEYDQPSAISEEFGQEAAGSVRAVEGADEVTPPRRSVLGKRKSVAHPHTSRAHRTSASPASKPSKAKVPTPSEAKTAKDKDISCDNENNESSWGDPDARDLLFFFAPRQDPPKLPTVLS